MGADELLALFFESDEAGEVDGGLESGFYTVPNCSSWYNAKEEKGWPRVYVHLVGKEDFKSLISSSTSSSYWAFWTSITVCPDQTRQA